MQIMELCSELLFIKQILEFLNISIQYPMIIRVDNVGAMFLGNNAVLTQQTKHISIRHHYIRQRIEDGIVKIVFMKSKLNTGIYGKLLIFSLSQNHETKFK